jgi:hypothetical protein
MNINNFPNPKLNLPIELMESKDNKDTVCFKAVDQYLNLVGEYIYTNINLDYTPDDSNHIHAWIQRIVSAFVLRSLYLRNSFVESMNSKNTIGIYLPLKAWIETVGVLASILDLLEKKLSSKELFEKLTPYAIGNRGKGDLRVGEIEAVNVWTMIEKADKYMAKMRVDNGEDPITADMESFFSDFYDVASNPSHPSFDAQELVGSLKDGGIWKAKEPSEIENDLVTTRPNYGGLLMAPLCVRNICQKIFEIEKDHFGRLNSDRYFN